ncbi:MAG TPA: hypothetical protein VFV99_01125 [Kofleriaceae bacterium]|nr:hypothetical protein [Kofleriaceae bacterium]
MSAVLVVARGPGLPTGVLLGETDRKQSPELDRVVLAELLTNAHDDKVVLALARLLFGDNQPIEHMVSRDRDGVIVGVVAVRRNGPSSTWGTGVLASTANSLAGWLSTPTAAGLPPHALAEALEEPVIAHEGGVVIVANRAVAKLLACEPSDLIGAPITRVTQRLSTSRTSCLVVGGVPRTALVFDRPPSRILTNVRATVESVLARHYPLVRQTACVAFDRREDVTALVAATAADELVTLALLEMSAIFGTSMPENQLRISVYRKKPWAVIELVASGKIAPAPDVEHVGSLVCAARTRTAGGQFMLDASQPNARTLRISLPVES